MDDLVPAEVSAGDLEDYVSEEPGFEQPRGASALTGAHPHRHAEFLVQVGDPHLEPFPHGGRKCAEGHAPDHKGIDLAHRRYPGVLPGCAEKLLGWEYSAQQRPDFELVPPCIQGRVREHGDPDELDAVQDAPGIISPSASPPRLSAFVDMESELVDLFAVDRADCVVGANLRAESASDTCPRGITRLIDSVIDLIKVRGFHCEPHGDIEGALPVHAQFDGTYRARGGAPATQGAPVLVPKNSPGQVPGAQ